MRRPATGAPEFGKANFYSAGKTGFTEGTPGVEAATVVTDDTLNHVVGELANAVEVIGVTALNAAQYDQLTTALLAESRKASARAYHQQIRQALLNQSTASLSSVVANDVGLIAGLGLVAVGSAAGVGAIRYSGNDGASWASLTPASSYTGILYGVVGFSEDGATGGFVFGQTGEIQSISGAGVMARQKTGGADIHTLICNANKTQWLAFDSAGRVWRKPYSTGTTWTDGGAVLSVTDLRDVCAGYVGSTPYLCAVEGVLIKRSTDDGATWASVSIPTYTTGAYRVIYTGVRGMEWCISTDDFSNPPTVGSVYTSSDLISWGGQPNGFSYETRFITPIPGGVLGVGYKSPYFIATSEGREVVGIYPTLAGFDGTGATRFPKRILRYLCKPTWSIPTRQTISYIAYLVRSNVTAQTLTITKMVALEAPPAGVET